MQTDANIGRVLEGKYEIVRVLGQGGMGVVYEARHRLINRRLAVKLLHAEYAQDSNLAERFRREAQSASAIGHDHIVDITDMGFTDRGELFIAMEFLEGGDLSSMLQDDTPFPADRSCHIMIQVLSALEAAHSKGIIHRDLKPANIFIIQNREGYDYVKLVDFGISKIQQEEEDMRRGLTRTGELLGTPTFMSPEQARGETDIGPASDIFSCGLILYRLLTGKTAFDDQVLTMLLLKIIDETPPTPQSVVPEIPQELSDAVMRAIEKNPQDRFPDAASFRRVLMKFSPETATQTGLAVTRFTDTGPRFNWDAEAGNGSRTPLNLAVTDPKQKSGKGLRFGLLAIVLLLVVGGAAFFVSGMGEDGPKSAPKGRVSPAAAPPPVAPAPSATVPAADTDSAPSDTGTSAPVETVSIQIRVLPPEATVSVDGEVKGTGTVSFEPPRDKEKHHIQVTADGYTRYERDISFDRDVRFRVQLSPEPVVKPRVRPSGAGGKGKEKGEAAAPPTPPQPETAPPTPPTPPPEVKDPPSRGSSGRGIRKIDEVNPW